MEATFTLLKTAQKDQFQNHSVVVGDFNFSSSWKKEEAVLTDNGFKDVMHDLVAKNQFTMPKKGSFPPWRPDKVVMEASNGTNQRKHWKATKAVIVGN